MSAADSRDPEAPAQPPCQACGSGDVRGFTSTCKASGPTLGKRLAFVECRSCGFVAAPENSYEFDSADDFRGNNAPDDRHGRVGTSERAGREFTMACMGKEILEHSGLPCASILIFGAGLSKDHERLALAFPSLRIAVCDLDNFQGVTNFIRPDSPECFDVVVACEVVEHFQNIASDFGGLISKVSGHGIGILSTNISDGSELSSLQYPFIGGHTAYYSGRSLLAISKRVDPALRVDFRAPEAALAQLGPRKRYVLLYASEDVGSAVAQYFSRHLMAPSEPARRRSMRERIQRVWNHSLQRLATVRSEGPF